VCEVPGGAKPSYAQDYYDRDNEAYKAWDAVSRDDGEFAKWLERL
jgi:glutaconate CoA-transferase subunit A